MKRSERLSNAIVDDDESVCRSLGRWLPAAGMQLAGIAEIESQQQFAASGERTPVIFITAHDASEARDPPRGRPTLLCGKLKLQSARL
ncbi:MAG: hypothetical protein WBL39_06330 [Terrimicrobiaceae bacterium]